LTVPNGIGSEVEFDVSNANEGSSHGGWPSLVTASVGVAESKLGGWQRWNVRPHGVEKAEKKCARRRKLVLSLLQCATDRDEERPEGQEVRPELFLLLFSRPDFLLVLLNVRVNQATELLSGSP
jgi:hypothetical protein